MVTWLSVYCEVLQLVALLLYQAQQGFWSFVQWKAYIYYSSSKFCTTFTVHKILKSNADLICLQCQCQLFHIYNSCIPSLSRVLKACCVDSPINSSAPFHRTNTTAGSLTLPCPLQRLYLVNRSYLILLKYNNTFTLTGICTQQTMTLS